MPATHTWKFKRQFRANAYGWRGAATASKRMREAVSEIKKVRRQDPQLAAEGAVEYFVRVGPATANVDDSNGTMMNACRKSVDELVDVIAKTQADQATRARWSQRIYQAVVDADFDLLNPAEQRWHDICRYPQLVSQWADRLVLTVRDVWTDTNPGAWFRGTTVCLVCLLESGRHDELHGLLAIKERRFWPHDRFGCEALARDGRTDEAIELALSMRDRGLSYYQAASEFCERVLIDAGRSDEAYERFMWAARSGTTNLAVFRSITGKYPDKDPRGVLADLIKWSGQKGKWFASARNAGLLDVAFDCARADDAEPATLDRASATLAESHPDAALELSLLALRQFLAGRFYEATGIEVYAAFGRLVGLAEKLGEQKATRDRLQQIAREEATRSNRGLADDLLKRMRSEWAEA